MHYITRPPPLQGRQWEKSEGQMNEKVIQVKALEGRVGQGPGAVWGKKRKNRARGGKTSM